MNKTIIINKITQLFRGLNGLLFCYDVNNLQTSGQSPYMSAHTQPIEDINSMLMPSSNDNSENNLLTNCLTVDDIITSEQFNTD